MKKILFICTGNTCRSSMAEGFFNDAVGKDSALAESFISFSAGIMAMDGDNASNNAIQAMREGWGIDISFHKAKSIRYEYIKNAYLILTMTQAHKDAILQLFPEINSKVYTLKEYAAETIDSERQKDQLFKNYNFDFNYDFNIDIPDPYGKPLELYKYCAHDIKKAVDLTIERLKLLTNL
ncbi:MAG TPA: low molecular weight protein arginine phosphatase [Clostridiales bacterium]|nr:low molecular weight protein arginine phosphatase [Clostridiales bacterium]